MYVEFVRSLLPNPNFIFPPPRVAVVWCFPAFSYHFFHGSCQFYRPSGSSSLNFFSTVKRTFLPPTPHSSSDEVLQIVICGDVAIFSFCLRSLLFCCSFDDSFDSTFRQIKKSWTDTSICYSASLNCFLIIFSRIFFSL